MKKVLSILFLTTVSMNAMYQVKREIVDNATQQARQVIIDNAKHQRHKELMDTWRRMRDAEKWNYLVRGYYHKESQVYLDKGRLDQEKVTKKRKRNHE